jgi:hypothetical protein
MGKVKEFFGTVCENCPLCKYARNNPDTPIGKIMEWHGKWCPAWQAYLETKEQTERQAEAT